MTAKQLPSIRGLGSMEPPWCSRNNHACTTDVQRLYKGCTRDVQGLHKGSTGSQYRSNAGATPSHQACPSSSPQCNLANVSIGGMLRPQPEAVEALGIGDGGGVVVLEKALRPGEVGYQGEPAQPIAGEFEDVVGIGRAAHVQLERAVGKEAEGIKMPRQDGRRIGEAQGDEIGRASC